MNKNSYANQNLSTSRGNDGNCPLTILLALNWARDKDPRLPLGHASILAALKAAGRGVESVIFPVNCGADAQDLEKQILTLAAREAPRPVDLAIGTFVWGELIIQKLLPALRRQGFPGRIILGGPQITFMERGLESRYPDADIFIRGAGESALVEVTGAVAKIKMAGVHYAGNVDDGSRTHAALELLPSPWLQHDWNKEPLNFVRMETLRGCPYTCSFCQHRAPNQGKRIAHLPESRIMKEIAVFCEKEVASVAILDPVFNVSRVSIGVLQAFESRGYRGTISLQCRAEKTTPEFLYAASRLNVTLEFGLQTIHDNEAKAIHRQNNIEAVDATLREVRSRGIHHEVSLIFGLPNQTLDSFRETVEWCLTRKVPVIKAFPLMLLRGTRLEIEASQWNLKQSEDAIPVVVSSSTFSESDWNVMNGISKALVETEKNHPKSLERIREITPISEKCRWSPPHT